MHLIIINHYHMKIIYWFTYFQRMTKIYTRKSIGRSPDMDTTWEAADGSYTERNRILKERIKWG